MVLQVRTREMEKISGFMYRPCASYPKRDFPVYDGSKWAWLPALKSIWTNGRAMENILLHH